MTPCKESESLGAISTVIITAAITVEPVAVPRVSLTSSTLISCSHKSKSWVITMPILQMRRLKVKEVGSPRQRHS